LQVVGGPHGSGSHDLDFAEVAAGFLGAFADEAEAPFDQIGVGELENDAVSDASGGAQSLWAVTGDPNAWNYTAGPGKFCGDAVEVNGFARVEVAEGADEFLGASRGVGFLPMGRRAVVAGR